MSLYTERHGMRKPINKSYDITVEMYTLLFNCCEKYLNNIAWKYPLECPDGYGCSGLDINQFNMDLKFEIPDLFRDNYGKATIPTVHNSFYNSESTYDENNQYALLDYIEFFAQNCKDVEVGSFHSYFGHHHINCKNSDTIYIQFQNDINNIFTKTGLLYKLTDQKIIERIVEKSPLTDDVEKSISQVKEQGTRQLLEEAIALYKQPYPESRKNSVEKIWDALERLKTFYTTMDKKTSASKIVSDMANSQQEFADLFNAEFKTLTDIGNNFRIRHHETSKIDITDNRHYDYFFNRCLSLIALAIQYLK